MHLAHCLKASVTSPEWPFFPPNSGIWILLENPFFFFLLPPLEVEDWWSESYPSFHHFSYLCFPGSFSLSCERRGPLDLHLKSCHRQRSVGMDPLWVKVLYQLRRRSSDGMGIGWPLAPSSQLRADHWPSQPA